MKTLLLFLMIISSHSALAYKIRYSIKGEIKTAELRLAQIKGQRLELYGADDSIAIRKLKRLNQVEVASLVDNKSSLGALVCREVFESDVVLGFNEFNNSTSFCFFKDGSLVPIDSLSSWTRKIMPK